MKKIVIASLLCAGSTVLAMEQEKPVQFSSAESIELQLAAAKIPAHVTQKLKLSSALADKELLPAEIMVAVEERLHKCIQKIEDPEKREQLQKHLPAQRARLFGALLKEHPEALEFVNNAQISTLTVTK